MLPNFSRAKTEEVKLNIPSTKNEEFAITSGEIQGGKTGYTTEKLEEEKKASKLQKENEELRRLVQDMTHMLKEQKKSVTLFQGVYDR